MRSSTTLVGGRILYGAHGEEKCQGQPCCIHNPSDHPMVEWDQRFIGGMMFRISPDGEMYPDPDSPSVPERPNAVRCDACGDVIVSIHVHDFVTCVCGSISVDGGPYYNKRAFRTGHTWTEIESWPIRQEWVEK